MQQLLQLFEAIFKEELGTFTGDKVTIYIDPSVVPKFCKARPLPYSMKEVVEKELQRLEYLGVIKPVKSLKSAAPIVLVLKSDRKSIRNCGNYKLRAQGFKVRAIPNTKGNRYVLNTSWRHYLHKIRYKPVASNLHWITVPRKLSPSNTHKGLFCYQRLPSRLSLAPGIFQRTTESLLQGNSRVLVYLDDILITGPSQEEHMVNLRGSVMIS